MTVEFVPESMRFRDSGTSLPIGVRVTETAKLISALEKPISEEQWLHEEAAKLRTYHEDPTWRLNRRVVTARFM